MFRDTMSRCVVHYFRACLRLCVFVSQANDQRLLDAKEYLQSLPTTRHSTSSSGDSLVDTEWYDLVIVVITMSRERTLTDELQQMLNLGYLTQTVVRLLQILYTDDTATFRRKKLIMCSVDPRPQSFTEARNLSAYVQTVFRYQNDAAELYDNIAGNKFEKEKDDYIYCLRTASRFLSPYYLVLEDDVLLDESAFATMFYFMHYLHLFDTVNWLFLKLYYPEKWSGYGRSWQTVVELGSYSILGGSLCVVVVVLLMSRHRKLSSSCHNVLLRFWFVVGAVFTVLLCLSLGRQHVESWRQYLVTTHRLVAAPGCCTQATLYPARVIPDLCNHLTGVYSDINFGVDLAIDGFAHIHGLKTYLIQPNIGKHIGFVSNLRYNSKSAQHFL